MNDFTIKTPTIRVPGLLGDDALQEQLKIFKQSGFNGGATPVPSGAVEMADRVQRDFIDQPLRSAARAATAMAPLAGPFAPMVSLAGQSATNAATPKLDPQQEAINTRSDVMSSPGFKTATSLLLGVTAPEGGIIDRMGTLTPEESERAQQDRVEQAREEEAAVRSHVETRQKLRGLTAEQAATLGLPVAPGSDPEADKVLKEQLELQDQNRLKLAADARTKAEGGPAPQKAWWLDAINSFDRSFADFFTSVGKSAAIGLLELPGEVTGVRSSGRSDVRAWFDTVDATMQKIIPPDKARDQDFINLLSGGAGSMTGFLAGGLVAKSIGLPSKAATTIIGAASQASVQYEDAEAHKGTELQRLVAFFAGAGLGATEGMPINRMLARAERASGGVVSQTLRHTAAGSLEEFVQELGQNLGQDVVAKWLYDEQRQLNWNSYIKAGTVGGLLGGMGGAATSVLQSSGLMPETLPAEEREQQKLETDVAARQEMDARQQASMQRVITDAQRQFDTITGDRPSAEPTMEEAAADAMGELPPPSRLAAQRALDVGAALEQAGPPATDIQAAAAETAPVLQTDMQTAAAMPTGTVDVPSIEDFKAMVATGAPLKSLPASASLNLPPVPTKEQMDASSTVRDVPLAAARATQSSMQWDRFNAGDFGDTLVDGYADKPVAVRKEDGEFLVFDGHHRAVQAINEGATSLPMHVIDAKTYAPEAAGRKPTQSNIDDDALLAELFGSTAPSRAAAQTLPLEGQPLVDLAMRAPKSEAFTQWFGDSKVVDEAGAPLVVYHGTGAAKIDQFRPEKIGSANDEGFYGEGYYFTPDRSLAQAYVPRGKKGSVQEVYLSLKNPFVWDLSTPKKEADTISRARAVMPDVQVTTTGVHFRQRKAWTTALKSAGFDGVQSANEIVAFEPTQIKSVNNRGNFDTTDPDILAARAPAVDALPVEGGKLVELAARAPKSEAFTQWFGDSKVATPEGQPQVVYHGTTADIKAFDPSKMGEATGAPSAKMGFFFASDPAVASSYAEGFNGYKDTKIGRFLQTVTGGRYEKLNEALLNKFGKSAVESGANVMPLYLSIKNPVVVDFGGSEYRERTYADIISEAKANGHDGVILRNTVDEGFGEGGDKVTDVFVAFEPTQIKSVNNRGNFDPNSPDLLASTSSTRGSYNAEPKRGTSGVAGQTDAAGDNVSLRKLADNFTKLLGLTVRQGRFTLKGADVMGQFSSKSGVIRMRTPNDISTLIHEGGHALEVGADGPLRSFVTGNRVALQTIAKQLYGGDTTKMSDKQKTSEGFAEFFRVYVTNRRYAEIHYPTITADFKTLLDTHNPQLRDGLQLIGDQYAAWLRMPSAQLVRNMVQSGRETVGINATLQEMRKEGVVNWFREWVNGVHSAVINRNDNLNRLVADVLNTAPSVIDLKRADDPRVLIRLAANSGQRAIVQLTDGIMPHRSVNPSTPGLRDVLLRYHGKAPSAQLGAIDVERQKDFAAYLVALRGIDEYNRYSQGIIERPPVAATLGDLSTTVTEMETRYGDDFKEAAKMAHQFSMGLWQKSYDAGLIDGETFADGNTRNFYVPLQRDMSDKEVTQSGISAAQARAGRSIVKRFRGSDRDIIDPMDALMQKTFALEKVIAENEVKVALAKLADKAGTVGALVERVPAHKLLGEQFSVQEIARSLSKDPTMSQADAADLMSLLEAAIDDGNRIALFRSQQASAAGENIIFFWEQGKLSALQLKDGDVGVDIINTLNAVGTESVPFLVDLIAYPSTVFRAAVTSWPDFLLVNFIRDQMSAFVLTEGYTPFVTGIRGVADEIRQKDWARQYNAAMGTMGGMNSSTLHEARVKNDIAALRKKGYIAQVFRDKTLGGAARGMARMTELTETGTRLGIFRKAYDRAVTDGLTPWEASVEASYISTDYIDFSLHGNRMLAWRRLIPFLNAQLQGLNKMVRTLAGDEVRQRKGLMFAVSAFFKDANNLPLSRTERDAVRVGRKAWLKMASLGIIGAVLNAVFQDDPDYQDTSEYLRTTGWIIPLGNGHIAYIPKPFELAMVSNIVERGMEAASGDKEAKNRLLRGMAMNLLPPTNPPAIQTLVEQFANWQSFSGAEIVPDYMRALEPELQYNHYTTEFAKQMGAALGWSPMRIDHVMNSFGASAYRDLANLYNMTDPSRPASDVTEWPMTRRFVRDARRGAVSSQDFWKVASTVTGTLRRAETTYKNYIESGREAAAENYLQELEPDERAYAVLNTHFKSEYKKLNPTYRTRQLTTIVSALRRELYSDIGVDNTGVGGEDMPYLLSATEKKEVDTLFSELARREVRNSLVYMKAPGWANKKPLDTESTIELLRTTSPDMAEEFERRVKKAKIYDADTIREYWPEVRNRLLQDGDQAFLKDIVAVAKAMR